MHNEKSHYVFDGAMGNLILVVGNLAHSRVVGTR